MTIKSVLTIGALMVASLSICSAKTYDLTLTMPAQAGKMTLNAGAYKLKIDGGNAVFTNLSNFHTIIVPVKVDKAESKFENTAVDTNNEGGVQHLQSIELQDTNSKLEF